MKRSHRNYSLEFKKKAVELSYARGSVKQICEELEVPISVLSRWRRESKDYGKNSFPGRGKPKLTEEQKEIALLKKQLKDISEEHEILKKVVSIFSKSDKWLGQYVLEKDWDEINGKVKRTHPNSKKLNNFLLKKLTETNDIYFDSKRKITPKQVKQKLKGPGGSTSFFDLAVKRVQGKYDEKVFSVAKSELSILYNLDEFLSFKNNASKEAIISKIKENRLERISAGRKGELLFEDSINKFRKNKKLMFQDITPGFLEKFKSFCSVYLGQKTRTITNQLIFVRTLFNIAVRDGIIDAEFYPFNDDKSKIKIGTSNKVGLNIQEVEKIEALSLDYNNSIWHTRNVWLIAFYFAGIRIYGVVCSV